MEHRRGDECACGGVSCDLSQRNSAANGTAAIEIMYG